VPIRVIFELGQLKLLAAPGFWMVALLEVLKIAMFHALYHHRDLSKVLCRVPRICSAHSEAANRENLDALQAVVRSSYHTMLMVEWSPALVAALTVQ